MQDSALGFRKPKADNVITTESRNRNDFFSRVKERIFCISKVSCDSLQVSVGRYMNSYRVSLFCKFRTLKSGTGIFAFLNTQYGIYLITVSITPQYKQLRKIFFFIILFIISIQIKSSWKRSIWFLPSLQGISWKQKKFQRRKVRKIFVNITRFLKEEAVLHNIRSLLLVWRYSRYHFRWYSQAWTFLKKRDASLLCIFQFYFLRKMVVLVGDPPFDIETSFLTAWEEALQRRTYMLCHDFCKSFETHLKQR